jgi:type VII secretion-associated protein (TIGR03931 family)
LVPSVTDTVLEVGPATVTRLTCRTQPLLAQDMVAAALAGIDDTVVLLRDRPVAVADLWRKILASSIDKHCTTVTLVHPSWWVRDRVARIVDAAAGVATDVQAVPRSAMLAPADTGAVIVEIAGDVVGVIVDGRPPATQARADDPAELAATIEISAGRTVLIDAPAAVSGAAEYAGRLRDALRRRGLDARLARVRVPRSPTRQPKTTPAPTPHRHRRTPALVAAAMALSLCAVGAGAARTRTVASTSDAVVIAEGRITVQIPPDWVVRRVTAGPGSRRIQVTSPAEPDAALHVTQSYAPAETLDRTAALLSRAVDGQPRGVFVDFNPADRRAGRPAVTYRELRIAREIRWTVMLDGSTRISIGCQSAPSRPDAIAEPCAQAIDSARELPGTNDRP